MIVAAFLGVLGIVLELAVHNVVEPTSPSLRRQTGFSVMFGSILVDNRGNQGSIRDSHMTSSIDRNKVLDSVFPKELKMTPITKKTNKTAKAITNREQSTNLQHRPNVRKESIDSTANAREPMGSKLLQMNSYSHRPMDYQTKHHFAPNQNTNLPVDNSRIGQNNQMKMLQPVPRPQSLITTQTNFQSQRQSPSVQSNFQQPIIQSQISNSNFQYGLPDVQEPTTFPSQDPLQTRGNSQLAGRYLENNPQPLIQPHAHQSNRNAPSMYQPTLTQPNSAYQTDHFDSQHVSWQHQQDIFQPHPDMQVQHQLQQPQTVLHQTLSNQHQIQSSPQNNLQQEQQLQLQHLDPYIPPGHAVPSSGLQAQPVDQSLYVYQDQVAPSSWNYQNPPQTGAQTVLPYQLGQDSLNSQPMQQNVPQTLVFNLHQFEQLLEQQIAPSGNGFTQSQPVQENMINSFSEQTQQAPSPLQNEHGEIFPHFGPTGQSTGVLPFTDNMHQGSPFAVVNGGSELPISRFPKQPGLYPVDGGPLESESIEGLHPTLHGDGIYSLPSIQFSNQESLLGQGPVYSLNQELNPQQIYGPNTHSIYKPNAQRFNTQPISGPNNQPMQGFNTQQLQPIQLNQRQYQQPFQLKQQQPPVQLKQQQPLAQLNQQQQPVQLNFQKQQPVQLNQQQQQQPVQLNQQQQQPVQLNQQQQQPVQPNLQQQQTLQLNPQQQSIQLNLQQQQPIQLNQQQQQQQQPVLLNLQKQQQPVQLNQQQRQQPYPVQLNQKLRQELVQLNQHQQPAQLKKQQPAQLNLQQQQQQQPVLLNLKQILQYLVLLNQQKQQQTVQLNQNQQQPLVQLKQQQQQTVQLNQNHQQQQQQPDQLNQQKQQRQQPVQLNQNHQQQQQPDQPNQKQRQQQQHVKLNQHQNQQQQQPAQLNKQSIRLNQQKQPDQSQGLGLAEQQSLQGIQKMGPENTRLHDLTPGTEIVQELFQIGVKPKHSLFNLQSVKAHTVQQNTTSSDLKLHTGNNQDNQQPLENLQMIQHSSNSSQLHPPGKNTPMKPDTMASKLPIQSIHNASSVTQENLKIHHSALIPSGFTSTPVTKPPTTAQPTLLSSNQDTIVSFKQPPTENSLFSNGPTYSIAMPNIGQLYQLPLSLFGGPYLKKSSTVATSGKEAIMPVEQSSIQYSSFSNRPSLETTEHTPVTTQDVRQQYQLMSDPNSPEATTPVTSGQQPLIENPSVTKRPAIQTTSSLSKTQDVGQHQLAISLLGDPSPQKSSSAVAPNHITPVTTYAPVTTQDVGQIYQLIGDPKPMEATTTVSSEQSTPVPVKQPPTQNPSFTNESSPITTSSSVTAQELVQLHRLTVDPDRTESPTTVASEQSTVVPVEQPIQNPSISTRLSSSKTTTVTKQATTTVASEQSASVPVKQPPIQNPLFKNEPSPKTTKHTPVTTQDVVELYPLTGEPSPTEATTTVSPEQGTSVPVTQPAIQNPSISTRLSSPKTTPVTTQATTTVTSEQSTSVPVKQPPIQNPSISTRPSSSKTTTVTTQATTTVTSEQSTSVPVKQAPTQNPLSKNEPSPKTTKHTPVTTQDVVELYPLTGDPSPTEATTTVSPEQGTSVPVTQPAIQNPSISTGPSSPKTTTVTTQNVEIIYQLTVNTVPPKFMTTVASEQTTPVPVKQPPIQNPSFSNGSNNLSVTVPNVVQLYQLTSEPSPTEVTTTESSEQSTAVPVKQPPIQNPSFSNESSPKTTKHTPVTTQDAGQQYQLPMSLLGGPYLMKSSTAVSSLSNGPNNSSVTAQDFGQQYQLPMSLFGDPSPQESSTAISPLSNEHSPKDTNASVTSPDVGQQYQLPMSISGDLSLNEFPTALASKQSAITSPGVGLQYQPVMALLGGSSPQESPSLSRLPYPTISTNIESTNSTMELRKESNTFSATRQPKNIPLFRPRIRGASSSTGVPSVDRFSLSLGHRGSNNFPLLKQSSERTYTGSSSPKRLPLLKPARINPFLSQKTKTNFSGHRRNTVTVAPYKNTEVAPTTATTKRVAARQGGRFGGFQPSRGFQHILPNELKNMYNELLSPGV